MSPGYSVNAGVFAFAAGVRLAARRLRQDRGAIQPGNGLAFANPHAMVARIGQRGERG